MNRTEIGNRLINLRAQTGLLQSQVADVIGVSKSTIGAYEQGVRLPSDDVKIKLANFYKVDLVDLFYK